MSLEEKFDEIAPRGVRCKTCVWYDQLDANDKAFFDAKSASGTGKTRLWKACRANGLPASFSSFRAHLDNPEHRHGSG